MTPAHCHDAISPVRLPRHTQVRRNWILRLLDRYLAAQALHRQHQALLRLDDTMLRDIGISRSMAEAITAKPVWDAPTHWKS